MENYGGLIGEVRDEFPSFRIIYKRSSKLMKVIGFLLKVISFGRIRSFFTDYATTIGNTVYVPDAWKIMSTSTKYVILRHERVHMRQAKRLSLFLYSFLYLFIPFPIVFSYFRTQFEMEAYAETIKAVYEVHGLERIRSEEFRSFIFEQFKTSSYMWMSVGLPGIVENWYYNLIRELEAKDKNR